MGTCIRLKSVCHRISYIYYSLRLGVISHVRRYNGTKVHACACVCVCVFNSMCVLERAIDRPTPTERWCVLYDFSRESRCILSFPGVSGKDMRTTATLAPDQPGPPKAPPSRALPALNGQRRSKESVPHSCPGRAHATSHWRKSDGCFVRPTYCWVYVI